MDLLSCIQTRLDAMIVLQEREASSRDQQGNKQSKMTTMHSRSGR
jgi:hypothetical protein